MYLSQLVINTRLRKAHYEHQTPYETHRTIMRAFPEQLPDGERILFRRETQLTPAGLRVLVQSFTEPDWSVFDQHPSGYFLDYPRTRAYPLVGARGERFVFRLVANPTVKKNGRRLGLLQEEEQWNWLQRKADKSGFECSREDVRITQHGLQHSQRRRVTHLRVQYDGILKVENTNAFKDALRFGIGPAKGYGFGLLSIARLHNLAS